MDYFYLRDEKYYLNKLIDLGKNQFEEKIGFRSFNLVTAQICNCGRKAGSQNGVARNVHVTYCGSGWRPEYCEPKETLFFSGTRAMRSIRRRAGARRPRSHKPG